MRRFAHSLICLLCISQSIALGDPQSALEKIKANRKELVTILRTDTIRGYGKLVKRKFSDEDLKLYQSITIERFTEANFTYIRPPRAEFRDGRRYILIPDSYYFFIYQCCRALIIDGKLKRKGAVVDYIRYCAENHKYQSKSIFPSAPTYFQLTDEEYKILKRYQRHTDALLHAAISFLILHEFAHHKMGHLDPKGKLSSAKEMEAEADIWALKTCLEFGFIPVSGAVLFLHLHFFHESDLMGIKYSSHYPALRRYLTLLEHCRDNIESYAHILRRAKLFSMVKLKDDEFLNLVQSEIEWVKKNL